MCVAIIGYNGKPTAKELENCAAHNADGAGLAWIDGGVVQYRRGLTLDGVKGLLPDIPLPYLLHFRFASIGGKDASLTHPFPVTADPDPDPSPMEGTAPAVLMHNGTWNGYRGMLAYAVVDGHGDKAPRGPLSDTRAMAYLAGLYGYAYLAGIDEKVAVLDALRGPLYFGKGWIEYKGMVVSNMYSLAPMPKATASTWTGKYWGEGTCRTAPKVSKGKGHAQLELMSGGRTYKKADGTIVRVYSDADELPVDWSADSLMDDWREQK